jgi:hypothetical protein
LLLVLLIWGTSGSLAQLSKPLASDSQLNPADNKYWLRLATDDERSEE